MTAPAHPLDPLTAEEIARTAALVRERHFAAVAATGDDGWRFASIELIEPPKPELARRLPGDSSPRLARATVWQRDGGPVYECTVDLGAGRLAEVRERPGVQPNFTNDEAHGCGTVVLSNPEVIAALGRRGIDDLELVLVDVWAYGYEALPPAYRGRRVGWCDIWVRSRPGANPYAHYVGGLRPIVDMNRMELLELQDDHDYGLPEVMGEYVPGLVPSQTLRTDLRPLEIIQPDGPSFTLEGNELRWQRWRMRIGFNHREGLVLHQLGYEDHGRLRPVAHRLSFAEMVIPYRDPSFDHAPRTAFDIGEWGIGYMTDSLERGCDCLGEVRYLDAVLTNARGEPYEVRHAICIHEEDDGVLWKHVDERAGPEVRRRRRLVVSFHATVANYEYLVYWRFYEDGNIECEVRATGIVVTTTMAEGAPPPAHGTVVDRRTYAAYHQHFIVARLDLDVDGTDNTVSELDSEALPVSAENPDGLAIVVRATPIRSEAEAGRDYDWSRQRVWRIANPASLNAHGEPVAYKLVPSSCMPSLLDPSSPVYRRAPVIGHQLWVTRHADEERWPAGEYPTQSRGEDGIVRWTAQDRSLTDADVVLWYVFGIHHVPRAEDWPVMPVDTVSFWLKPFGFFDRNPALDVAPESGHCER
jgi:primary-amine oxidase